MPGVGWSKWTLAILNADQAPHQMHRRTAKPRASTMLGSIGEGVLRAKAGKQFDWAKDLGQLSPVLARCVKSRWLEVPPEVKTKPFPNFVVRPSVAGEGGSLYPLRVTSLAPHLSFQDSLCQIILTYSRVPWQIACRGLLHASP